jgi:hypothetical protein
MTDEVKEVTTPAVRVLFGSVQRPYFDTKVDVVTRVGSSGS